jgi:hypothetical protein
MRLRLHPHPLIFQLVAGPVLYLLLLQLLPLLLHLLWLENGPRLCTTMM